jgi:hypothetical protein
MLRPHALAVTHTIIWICLFSPISRSQGLGNIVGTVTDPSGAVLANAKVTALETTTGASRAVLTSTTGGYVIPGL